MRQLRGRRSLECEERAPAALTTSVATTAKALAMGSQAERALYLSIFSRCNIFLMSWLDELAPSPSPKSFAVHWSSTNNPDER